MKTKYKSFIGGLDTSREKHAELLDHQRLFRLSSFILYPSSFILSL